MNNAGSGTYDVLVVGAGPAGVAAAVSAAESGRQVCIVDDNPALGGQIWRGEVGNPRSNASQWAERLRRAKAEVLCGTRIVHQPQAGCLLGETSLEPLELRYQQLILATGARERFLPFPGWTLPNVMGAGGLQALAKSGLPIAGKRIVVAGSGPLLIAVAAYLRSHGANIVLICEQASWTSLAKFTAALRHQPEKIGQALMLRKQLSGVPFSANCWPVRAEGESELEAVVISRGGTKERVPCDYLACGFHLVPNSELPALLGCRLRNGFVEVDDLQRTSVPDIYCAGEPTSIGGVEQSLVEGQIAGLATAAQTSAAEKLVSVRKKLQKFSRALSDAFSLRAELRELPLADTIVCRCEDVTYSRARRYDSWRTAKLQTRCGMGPCQGRVCGPAAEFLFNWTAEGARPPIFPTLLENLAVTSSSAT